MSGAFKFTSGLRELRLHLCQKGKSSQGVRDFIEKNYVELKSCNPKFPILIRECSGVQPKLWARYEFGREKCVPLTNLPAEDVFKQLKCVAQ